MRLRLLPTAAQTTFGDACLAAFLAVFLLAASPRTAHADSFSTFALSVAFAGGTAAGTVTFDTTTALFTAANVQTVSAATATLTGIIGQGPLTGVGSGLSFLNIGTAGSLPIFDLVLPVDSFAGYTGSAVCQSPVVVRSSPFSSISRHFGPSRTS